MRKVFLVLVLGGAIAPEMEASVQERFFEAKVRPVLADHCYSCHSTKTKKRGGLILDTRQGLRRGGDTGPAVVPGRPDRSLLIQAVRYHNEEMRMPPAGKLPDAVIADLVKWVKDGAAAPREVGQVAPGSASAKGRDKHWAFQPPRRPPSRNIDSLIDSRLRANRIVPVSEASRLTLARRLFFDLTGLPPTAEELDAVLADRRPDAYERLVDRLLASPHFGERWGRHWLDVARFSESAGPGRVILFHDAWRYRDYVIASFNADKPYDRFVREQVAGDLLPTSGPDERQQHLIATTFLAMGPAVYERRDKKALDLDHAAEQVETVGQAFLAMTLGCARCHDHKFDPIPTRDYYAMLGIFTSTRTLLHPDADGASISVRRPLPLPDARGRTTMSVEERAEVGDDHVRIRGAASSLGPRAPRGFLRVATIGPASTISARQSGRLELARWLAGERNPLTARVMVNRVWQKLIGVGLVRTADNFGTSGEAPSHPDLLDELALRFDSDGWSIKGLVRSIVLSRAYRRSSAFSPAAARLDPENRLLWRMNRRRLEAEPLRDAILAVSGQLDRTLGGPTIRPGTRILYDYSFDHSRRSVYTPVFRGALPDLFEVFDFSDPSVSSPTRATTTTSAQALYLLNSPFVRVQAGLAARAVPDLDRAFRAALGRTPTALERQKAREFLRAAPDVEAGMKRVYQALFACLDFRYLD